MRCLLVCRAVTKGWSLFASRFTQTAGNEALKPSHLYFGLRVILLFKAATIADPSMEKGVKPALMT